MGSLRFGATTVEWTDGRVAHDLSSFPELTTVDVDGRRVRAYADRPATIDEMFRNAVDHAPDREAVAFPEDDVRLTYRELADRADAVGAGLQAAGVGAGDAVMIHLPNEVAFMEVVFACARIGALSMPTNTRLTARELNYHLEDGDPAAVVTAPSLISDIDDTDYALDDGDVFVTGSTDRYGAFDDLRGHDPDAVSPPAIDEHDPAALLYTSGTTGDPKGCVASQFNLVNAARNYETVYRSGDGLRSFVTVPLFHSTGLVANTLHTVACAGTVVVVDGYDPDQFLRVIEQERIEFVIAVPTNYILAAEKADPGDYDLSSWDVGAYGGAPMPATVVSRVRDAFPDIKLTNAYGTTETVAGLATTCPDEYTDEYAHTVGLPTPPVELTVVGEDGEPVGPGQVGELAVRGPIIANRYLRKPEETAEAFRDGWHYTGDLAAIDANGFVELKGRNRDLIVRGGENVYALDIEEALVSSEKVFEASVTGFPDDVLGERIFAAAVPKEGVRLTEADLRAVCEAQLAEYKHPDIFRIVDELPRNPNGKVMKGELLPEPLQFGIRAG